MKTVCAALLCAALLPAGAAEPAGAGAGRTHEMVMRVGNGAKGGAN